VQLAKMFDLVARTDWLVGRSRPGSFQHLPRTPLQRLPVGPRPWSSSCRGASRSWRKNSALPRRNATLPRPTVARLEQALAALKRLP
jgi:hypothetical protein